jgi:hypothetical protein
MKRLQSTTLAAAVMLSLACGFCHRVAAGILVSEPFSYPADQLLNGQGGGFGFSGPWDEYSTSPGDTIDAGSLRFNFLGVSGNSLSSTADQSYTGALRDLASPIAGTSGTTIWVSYLIRKASDGGLATDKFFGLALYSNASNDALFIGDTSENDFYSLGIAGSADGQVASSSRSVVSSSATLLVVKISFVDGADRVDLFVNPDVTQGEPTFPSVTKSDLNIPDVSAIGILGGVPIYKADEIRIGTQFRDVAPRAAKLVNISTRLRVETGDNALIGGFYITGNQQKKVIVRGIGPSLAPGVQDALRDPILELHDSSGADVAQNDNWRSNQEQEIINSTVPPSDDHESAIVRSLAPGSYTAILRGVSNTTGVGLVEVYDLQSQPITVIANISTRGLVGTDPNVMIGGMIITGDEAKRVLFRAIGPSLTSKGISGALQNPTLELRDKSGTLIAFNDNWRSDQEQEIIDTTVPPENDAEAAIVWNLAPGNYTAILRGRGGASGVALVEAYGL